MNSPLRLEDRIHRIGHQIFEIARASQPRIYEQAWWQERATRMLDGDPLLRTRAFQFVDCLPSLRSNHAIAGHLKEYLAQREIELPSFIKAALASAPKSAVLENTLGNAARMGARRMAGRFITGFDLPSVNKTLARLRREGMAFTLDVLGEFTTSYAAADRYAQAYHDLLDQIPAAINSWSEVPILDRDRSGPMPRMNLSIKLTSLDPYFDAIDPARSIRVVGEQLRPLFRRAREADAFVNIDMESFKHRDVTLELFKTVLMEDEFRDWTNIGIVLQAYLRDGEQQLDDMLQWARERGTRFAIRLVKGAYWDAETAAAVRAHKTPPVWTNKWESDACYERMAGTMLEHAELIRPAFASHNVRSLAFVMARAEERGLEPLDYEIQMLYGMGDPLKTAIVEMGRCLRVYCPYGDLMPGMGYLIRRLLENTSNEGFLKQGFTDPRSYDRLLADPQESRPPSSPLPSRRYQNTFPEESTVNFINASNTNFAHAANREKMSGAIAYVRGEFGRHYPFVINGQATNAGHTFASHNPSNAHEIVGEVAQASPMDVERAVAAARKAFADWRCKSATERAALLRKAADRIEMRRFELAATMILEVGKPWREADADVTEAIDHCRYYADQIEWIQRHPRLRDIPGEDNALSYSPKGVCAVISPWAFPLAILTGMTTAAIAAGNTVVMKPARQASVVAAKLVDILHAVGFPNGVVNFLPGVGSEIGKLLVEHPDVNVVAFTGSRDVGVNVIRSGAVVRSEQAFIKKMIVEMGGKNAIIVDEDADLDGAIQGVVESAFSFAGQKCSSCSRLIVLSGIYESFAQRLKAAVESLPIGPAESPSTIVGPVIDAEARNRINRYVEMGGKESRVLVTASKSMKDADGSRGFFVPPTVIMDIAANSQFAQHEIFGPVLAMMPARDFDDALTIANSSRYALTGGVYSRSPANIARAREEFAVGNLYINRKITGSQVDAQPFGGFKLSGTGVKAGSPDYILHFMDARCITENTLRSGLVPSANRADVGQS
ncbi:MAG: bifunctional proline dehydrogenase/L-glutamate gamma-semialdehyde dehydrogenase [Planctomycetes bacterium]|nr:bifunctional proline dehydrogenase/L-glutamate gamma-semialdehyde dehydrogenase [Planctomycetota bacterium]MBI3834073.1 bifunctional proline dehydrogenase/L-glutamate gamma-semialdehyde dehydrogenase [Planctomycetota bacterium]